MKRELNKKLSKAKKRKRMYNWDIFYDIHGDFATASVIGRNMTDAKKVFKKVYGRLKITGCQKRGLVNLNHLK